MRRGPPQDAPEALTTPGRRRPREAWMKLTPDQTAAFEEQGYLFVPSLFSRAEIDVLKRELSGIFAQDRKENVREKDGKTVRTTFAAHTFNEAFRRLGRHPRMVEPVMQL